MPPLWQGVVATQAGVAQAMPGLRHAILVHHGQEEVVCMKNGRTPLHLWGRWCPADYLSDETVRLCAARGNMVALAVYFHILQVSRQAGGDVPADIEGLSAVLGMPRKLVARGLAPWVQGGKLQIEGGRLFHPRVRREVEHDLAFREAARISGTAGGQRSASRTSKGTLKGALKGTLKAPSTYPEPVPVPVPVPVPEPERTATDLPAAAQPAGQALAKKLAKRPETTWLTPYSDAWTDRWGAESSPPIGEMLRSLAEAEKKLGGDRMECVARWRRFLAQADSSLWSRPARFAQGLGEWGEKGVAPALRPSKQTAGERTMSAAKEFIAKVRAREGEDEQT